MRFIFPIIFSLILLLVASVGSAGDSKGKSKRKLDDTSSKPQHCSSASKRLQQSGSSQPSQSHSIFNNENEPHQQQASPLRLPKPFDLNIKPEYEPENKPEIISLSSSEETISADLVGPSGGHFAVVPSEEDEDEVEFDDDDIGTSIPLNQVSPLPQMGLEEMPAAASTAETELMTRNIHKNPEQEERAKLKRKKQDKAIHSLTEELRVAATQKSSKAKWQTLEAYGQYILWLEKILKNKEGILNHHEISNYMKQEFEKKIKGITDEAEIRRLKKRPDGRNEYLTIEYGKWILLLILPKLYMKKPQDVNVAYAIDWAKKYTKRLREEFLKYCAKEAFANRPNFFDNFPSTDQPASVTISDLQPDKELELEEWNSFKEDVKREMGIPNSIKTVGIWQLCDAYRRDILWLESLLLFHRQKIRDSLVLSGKQNLIPTFDLLLISAETNRTYEHTSADIYKLTPEEIASDPETIKIHDALETVGEEKTNAESIRLYKVKNKMAEQALYAILPKVFMKKVPKIDINTLAFEWARQYRKILQEDYLAPFQNVWRPKNDFMPDILKRRNERSGAASTRSTHGKENRQKMKQIMHEH